MSKLSEPQRPGPIRVARIFLSATVLICILASVVPVAAVASGSMCTLACCEGHAPHAAGSCMNGSCHTGLLGKPESLHFHTQKVALKAERLCGLLRITSANSFRQGISRIQFDDISRQPAKVSPASLGNVCEPDCGSFCVSSFSNRNRQRSQAALASFNSPRPSLSEIRLRTESCSFRNLTAQYRQSAPRGPPPSS
jgi:hypothetical protein